jgi:N-acetylmuramoyl-L-alanine amidase
MEHLRRARTRAIACATLALALAALLAGCAALRPRPPVRPRPAPGYEALRDTLARVDASGLAGRRVALDPGHGGSFRGALGVNGLAEAEVNLGVALRLRDLLAARGAQVFLTREDDRDFTTPADSSLRSDLAERARLAAESAPDLFVSIHHNADPRGAHDVNETQTYYKLGDEGPSLDAAQDVHRALVRNVGIAANKVVPGNFYVLRTSAAPALLTEASYVTNPDVEARLREPDKQRLEAEALFVGLARYFARHAPVIEELRAVDPAAPAESARFTGEGPTLQARVRGAFDQARLTVDGVAVEPVRDGARLSWRPTAPWTAGHHEATLAVRLAGEGAARARAIAFEVAPPWTGVEVTPFGDASLDAAHPVLALRLRGYDTFGRLVRDSASLRVRFSGIAGLAPAETTVAMRDGVGWAYLRARHPLAPGPTGALIVTGGAPGVTRFVVQLPVGSAHGAEGAVWTGITRLMPQDVPFASALGTAGPTPRVPWLNRDGFAVLPRDAAGPVSVPALPGYRAWAADSELPPRFVAIAGGALHGRRIVVDPEGGGDDAAGQGPGGTRGATLNLEVARALAGFLAAAGAEVRLARDGDLALSDVERVQLSEAFHAERFVRVSHRGPARIGHAPGAVASAAWATQVAAEMSRMGLPAPPPTDEAQYVVQQTSCPALLAVPAALADEAAEARLLAPGALRAEAYALFLGIARAWAPDADWPADSLRVLGDDGRPVPAAAVTLGGALVIETDAQGLARFARTEPGPMLVEADDPRAKLRSTVLEYARGAVLTGTSGR